MSATIQDIFPLTPLQQGMLLHSLLEPEAGFYLQQVIGELREQIDPAALKRAWAEVVGRHPMLRAAFRWEGLDEPFQEIARQAEVPFAHLDWGDVAPGDNEVRAWALMGMNVFLGLRYGVWDDSRPVSEITAAVEALLREGIAAR